MKIATLFIFTILCFSSFLLSAQPGGDPGGGGNPSVPITGIEVLIGLGGALGLKKMMSKKKNSL
jgi:hypothetical protein